MVRTQDQCLVRTLECLPLLIPLPELLGRRKISQRDDLLVHRRLASAIVDDEAVAIRSEDEWDIEHL